MIFFQNHSHRKERQQGIFSITPCQHQSPCKLLSQTSTSFSVTTRRYHLMVLCSVLGPEGTDRWTPLYSCASLPGLVEVVIDALNMLAHQAVTLCKPQNACMPQNAVPMQDDLSGGVFHPREKLLGVPSTRDMQRPPKLS